MPSWLTSLFNQDWIIQSLTWSALMTIVSILWGRFFKNWDWKRTLQFAPLVLVTALIGLLALRTAVVSDKTIDLRVTAEWIDIGDFGSSNSTPALPRIPAVLVRLKAANVGMPTTVAVGPLDLTNLNGRLIRVDPKPVGPNNYFEASDGKQLPIPFEPDLLRAGTNPIPTGGTRYGVFVYLMPPEVTRQDLLAMKHGTVNVYDVSGQTHAVQLDWTGRSTKMP
jgi:hypothetical protein